MTLEQLYASHLAGKAWKQRAEAAEAERDELEQRIVTNQDLLLKAIERVETAEAKYEALKIRFDRACPSACIGISRCGTPKEACGDCRHTYTEATGEIDCLKANLEAAIARAETAEARCKTLQCCGTCEYWMWKYCKCEHPEQRESECGDYQKDVHDSCELWQVGTAQIGGNKE